ncbi:hypothetical protein SpiGrapes_0377 [Sphaerochaeta pleomorpha str. Grapes]|uniref:Uncharacterized protein n=1 Tax=Sphaerochaeta pleomorpha (strain ATCC BAA-1885 / DSM 22778 / Grapes) TaxID=158190 RepID=G8QVK2_SPHPG|nr:hypothetical protein [Sphaerochaeta pleomorpha]AEV28235.1 hypothetical protein SpiGrapes_0377 [Sphaerochaeta pleomorpha str. Grapes]
MGKPKKPPVKRKKKVIVFFCILFVALILVCLPMIRFVLKPNLPVVTAVYDKTVPNGKVREHTGLFWFLKQKKVIPVEGKTFAYSDSYYGLHWDSNGKYYEKPLPFLSEKADLLYIADTYGIYRKEQVGIVPDVAVSNLIYGGLTQTDVHSIRDFLNTDRANTVVAEYNTFGTPTHPSVRAQMESLLQTKWSGWVGHYVKDLAEEGVTVEWERNRYEKTTGRTWDFTGNGYVLVNEESDILILDENDVGKKGNELTFTAKGTELTGISVTGPYQGLFDVVSTLSDAETLAYYSLDVTDNGLAKLKAKGLAPVFPAIIRNETAFHTTYYLGGNYAALNYKPRFYFWEGVLARMQKVPDTKLDSSDSFYWKTYIPLLNGIYKEAEQRKQVTLPNPKVEIYQQDGVSLVSRTKGKLLQVYSTEGWKDFFIRGVNIGIALPGRWYTEFPADKAVYYRFLEQIGAMKANTIRIYTLLDPQFYQALDVYNRLHPEQMLYLLQEIWPEEEPAGNDYLSEEYRISYQQEIRYVVDAIHGKASIAERRGRAFGEYRVDVSPYVLGLLVGRELEPQEVEATDLLNKGHSFHGDYLFTNELGTPTEAWLAESADYALSYQEQTYGWQNPVAIVNWPTLDALDHPSEREANGVKKNEYNDRTTVDINHIELGKKMKGGLFGAYHIYPNYPDFMNNDPQYSLYSDELGRFRYGGYLQEFMAIHTKYPALVAEFGLATGMGNAHMSPDGYNHGGMTEQEQGEGIVRMFEAIEHEGYAGGVIFEWMDEWAKKTWVTEPYMIPYDRKILWHNAVDPEQNYGILAMESVKPKVPDLIVKTGGEIEQMEVSMDVSYLYLDLTFSKPVDLNKEHLYLGLDTYGRARGETRYGKALMFHAPSGMEYLVSLTGKDTSRLLVIPPYNYASYRYASYEGVVDSGIFEPMQKLINKERAQEVGTPIASVYEDTSALGYGSLEKSNNLWNMEGNVLSVRIPWTRINVSDPSRGRVLDDTGKYNTDPLKDQLATTLSEGIGISFVLVDASSGVLLASFPEQDSPTEIVFPWKNWDEPEFKQRLKDSYPIIQKYFERFSAK